MPTTDPIQVQINQILQRISAIDGIGLSSNLQGQLAALNALILGLKKTLGNVNMGYKSEISALQIDYLAFKSQVTALLNIQVPSS